MAEKRHILALIGLRCTGKSSVGRILAHELSLPFADLDDEIVALQARIVGEKRAANAGEILATWGEPTFRSLEAQALEEVIQRREPCVLATGGGVVETAANRSRLGRRAISVWLRVDVAEMQRRLRADSAARPALTGSDAAAEIPLVSQRRSPLYAEVADHAIDCGPMPPEEIAELVLDWLRDRPERGDFLPRG